MEILVCPEKSMLRWSELKQHCESLKMAFSYGCYIYIRAHLKKNEWGWGRINKIHGGSVPFSAELLLAVTGIQQQDLD